MEVTAGAEAQLLITGAGGDQPLIMSAEDAAQLLAQAGLQLADLGDSERIIIGNARHDDGEVSRLADPVARLRLAEAHPFFAAVPGGPARRQRRRDGRVPSLGLHRRDRRGRRPQRRRGPLYRSHGSSGT